MSRKATKQLAALRRAWNVTPTIYRMAFLLEVIAAGALHKRSLPAIPRTNVPVLIAPQMEKASIAIRRTDKTPGRVG